MSVVVQWLKLSAYTEGHMGLIPGPELSCVLCSMPKVKKTKQNN